MLATPTIDMPPVRGYAPDMELAQEMHLLHQALSGCDASFRALVEEHSPQLLRLAWRMLGNHSDAEDIVQEAFLRLHRHLPTFRGDSRLSTWLYRTVTRLAIDVLRREKLKRILFFSRRDNDAPDPVELFADPRPGQESQLIAKQQLAVVRRQLDKLSAQQRAVLTLRHQEQLPLLDIAELLGISEGSVKTHLHRAVRSLRSALDKTEVLP
jgi:RNA polymerase sigma-70 factor (ECF subfamily)